MSVTLGSEVGSSPYLRVGDPVGETRGHRDGKGSRGSTFKNPVLCALGVVGGRSGGDGSV